MRNRSTFAVFTVLFLGVFLTCDAAHADRRRPFARAIGAVARAGVFAGAAVIRGGARIVGGAARLTARTAVGAARLGAAAVRGTAILGARAAIGAGRIVRGAARLAVGLPAIPPDRRFSALSGPSFPSDGDHSGGGPGGGPAQVSFSSARPFDESGFPSNANFRLNVRGQSCLATFTGASDTNTSNPSCKALVKGSCLGLSDQQASTVDGERKFTFEAGSEIAGSSLRGRSIERTAVMGATTAEVKFACSADEVSKLTAVSLDLALDFQKAQTQSPKL